MFGCRFVAEKLFSKVSGQQTTPVVAAIVSDTELTLKFPFDEPVQDAKFKVTRFFFLFFVFVFVFFLTCDLGLAKAGSRSSV